MNKVFVNSDGQLCNMGKVEGGAYFNFDKTNRIDQPLITIITSTFNAANDLCWTIESMRKQTYPNIQWIVADGASTDGTIDILKSNEDIIDYWFSEPDKGIYDAWNKALIHAKGEWIQFVGAGDELASPHAINDAASYLSGAYPIYDIVYGRIQIISEKDRVLIEEIGKPWGEMKGKWIGLRPELPVHPEVFHHKSIMMCNPVFDINYRIAGDSHLLLKHVLSKEPLYIPILIDKMPLGGISGNISNSLLVAKDIIAINKDLGITPPVSHVVCEGFKLALKMLLSLVFSQGIVFLFADLYRRITGKKIKWSIK